MGWYQEPADGDVSILTLHSLHPVGTELANQLPGYWPGADEGVVASDDSESSSQEEEEEEYCPPAG